MTLAPYTNIGHIFDQRPVNIPFMKPSTQKATYKNIGKDSISTNTKLELLNEIIVCM